MKVYTRTIRLDGDRLLTLTLNQENGRRTFKVAWYPEQPPELKPEETQRMLNLRQSLLNQAASIDRSR